METIAFEKTFEHEKDHWWFAGRRKIVFDTIERYAAGKMKLVEVGCGTGYTLEMVGGFGQRIGVEKDFAAIVRARRPDAWHSVCGDINHLPILDHSADCVLLLDVLEHVDDENAALSEISRICAAGGSLIVTVPAFQCLWSGEDVVSRHRRRYTRARLIALLDDNGFCVEKASYFNFFLLPFMLLVILYNRFFNRRSARESNLFPIPRLLNRICAKILGSESGIMRYMNFPVGSSILCAAKK